MMAGLLMLLAFSNLVLRIHFSKETEHLTFVWILLVLIAQILLVIYGYMNKAYGIYIPAILFIVGVLYILHVKLNYGINKTIENDLKTKNIL